MKLKNEIDKIFLKNMVISSDYHFDNVNDYYSFLLGKHPLVLKNDFVYDNVCSHRFNLIHPIGYGNKDWKCSYHNFDQSHSKKYDTFKYENIYFLGNEKYKSSLERLFDYQDISFEKHYYNKSRIVNANWKLIIESVIESLHVKHVHNEIGEPFLTKDKLPESHRVGIHSYDHISQKTEKFKRYFDEWYWKNFFIWPNAWLSQIQHYILLVILLPISDSKTKVVFDVFIQKNDLHQKVLQYVNKIAINVIETLFKEDLPLIEGCQIGLESEIHRNYNLTDDEPRIKWFYETYSEYKYKLDNQA